VNREKRLFSIEDQDGQARYKKCGIQKRECGSLKTVETKTTVKTERT